MNPLYKITGALVEVGAMIDEGIPEDQLIETIKDLKDDFDEKVKGILFVLANMDGEMAALKAEEKRLYDRRKRLESYKSNLQEYLRDGMSTVESGEVSNGVHSVKLGKPSQVIESIDDDLLPDNYKVIKTTVSPDKRAILKDAKESKIQGVTLGLGKPKLIIK